MSSVPGSGGSPGEGNGNPLQYSCLENSMDRGAWRATVRGVTKGSDMTEPLSAEHTYQALMGQLGGSFFVAPHLYIGTTRETSKIRR